MWPSVICKPGGNSLNNMKLLPYFTVFIWFIFCLLVLLGQQLDKCLLIFQYLYVLFQITDTVFHHQVQLSSQLIHKAILCHLTTCGRSVVIGRTPGRINVVFIFILKACSTSVKQTVNSGTMEAPCSTEQNSMNKDIMLGSKVLN